jgi:hypothetical protein
MRNINIRGVLNGYVVDVGCQSVVFSSKRALLDILSEYLDKPAEVEKRFIANAVNPMEAFPQPIGQGVEPTRC